MKTILVVHNYYQQAGGEDRSFETEAQLLERYGHRVHRYTLHNDQIKQMGYASLAVKTVWNAPVYRELRQVIQAERPAVVHFNNTFPLVSPAAYYAVQAEGIPVVQSLRNYRLACLNGLFFRNGNVCEECLGETIPWAGIRHACYHDSTAASSCVATMLVTHRMLQTWTKQVDVYVALSVMARAKLIQAGLPADRVVVKPNCLSEEPALGDGKGGYALYVGRLSPEKGIHTLLAAWRNLGARIPLKIVGDGPMVPEVVAATSQEPNIEWLGQRHHDEVCALMGAARMLVFPSEWYETFGRVAMEAFAVGTPVIVAHIGAIAELVEHTITGLHFRPGDVQDLVRQVEWMLAHPDRVEQMRRAARATFEARYTARRNYEMLISIYERARHRHYQPVPVA